MNKLFAISVIIVVLSVFLNVALGVDCIPDGELCWSDGSYLGKCCEGFCFYIKGNDFGTCTKFD
ncbi:unnamed protein product [Callosobruchus maculatus]|uniref:Uncharacterized protein n=1 Tax=Callosobruchus maculatus TaxID=64391 RepID=A0A653BIH7_CALMS|nr:unnamed protein product [Callosobruchus maculatus]